jgi:DNA-binding NarL/FixJ family response regulator
MGALRLLVADGNEIVRKGLCALVREQPGWELAAEARDGREAVEIAKQLKPEVAILDVAMPFLNGLEVTRQIAKSGSSTKVLLLTTTQNAGLLAHQAAEAGAHGYLSKSDTAKNLISAVEALRRGKTFFSTIVDNIILEGYFERASRRMDPPAASPVALLTDRQRQVVRLLADEYSNKEVAAALKISPKTAATHRANIMHRINCHTVVGLARYAIRNHIIEA